MHRVDNDVARIVLNDPARLNAVSVEMAERLSAAFEFCDREARVIVLSASGAGFCAGADLRDPAIAEADDGGALLERHFNPLGAPDS